MEFNPMRKIDGMDEFLHHMSLQKDPTYYDPWRHIDYSPSSLLKENKNIERAIWKYDPESRVSPLILPTYLSEDFAYALPTDAPAYNAIPRKASKGATHEFVRITKLGEPSAYWVAQDEAPDYVAPDTERVTKEKKICETWGGLTGFLQASGRDFKDLLAEAHKERLTGLLTEGLEDSCLNGTGTDLEPTGFLTWQGLTNSIDCKEAAVTLADIIDAMKLAFDAGGDLQNYGFAITDPVTYNYVKNLLTEYMGYINVTDYDMPWGLKTFAVDGMPFIKSRKMPTTEKNKKILMLDRRHCYAAVLQDVTTELYGKTKDAQEFAIKWYGEFINEIPEYCAVVHRIL